MKRVISIILASIIIVISFVCIKNITLPKLMKNANYGIGRLCAEKNKDIVFIGSSMFRHGLDIEVLEEKNMDVYLLAYNGHQPFTEVLQIKELLKNDVKINKLIVDMYAFSLTSKMKISDIRLLQDTSPEFKTSIFNTLKTGNAATFSTWYEMMITGNNEVYISWPISFRLINSRYKNGGSSNGGEGKTHKELVLLNNDMGGKDDINYQQVTHILELVELCNENNIEIVFLETPKYTHLYENKNYCDIMREYISFLKDKRCKIVISDKTASELNDIQQYCTVYKFENKPEYFSDLIHMSKKGKKQFTNDIIPVLNKTA